MAVEVAFLKLIPYFSRLTPHELDSVKKLVFERKVERGDIIMLEGEPAEALYFVGSGAVKMFRTSIDGKEQVLNIVRPGNSFNDVAVFDGGPNLASAQAMGPVTLCGILKHDLNLFLQDHPRTGINIADVLAAQGNHEEWERSKRIFNILSDRVETVTPWLARKVLSNTKNGVNISWLTRFKVLRRFFIAPFHKRKIFD